MLLISHESTPLRLVIAIKFSVELVHQDTIFINDRTKDQVSSLFLHELVSKCTRLIETCGCADSEDGLPSAAPSQAIVQFVCKLDTRLVVLVVRIVKEATIRVPSEVSECLQVLEDTFSHTEDKEID